MQQEEVETALNVFTPQYELSCYKGAICLVSVPETNEKLKHFSFYTHTPTKNRECDKRDAEKW